MAETFFKETNCVLCADTFKPVTEPEEDKSAYKIYCSSCANWLPVALGNPVRITLREALGVRGDALALAVQTCLALCHCGSPFSHDAGDRCLSCLDKIARETRQASKPPDDFHCPWNMEELKKSEPKIFEYIIKKLESKGETLGQLIEKFEAGEIDAETYLEGIDSIQFGESTQISVIQTWAMILGPELAFRAAEEHGLVDRYGARILVRIANGLEISTGKAPLATLNTEKGNWEGTVVGKELSTFIAKIGGGF